MLFVRAGSSSLMPPWLKLLAVLVLYLIVASGGDCEQGNCEEEDERSGLEWEEGWQWWLENATNGTNYTELCTGMINTNSSEPSSSYPEDETIANISSTPCQDINRRKLCRVHNYTTLTTDPLSYVNAQSTIIATVEPNATEGHDTLYYKLCYSMVGRNGRSEVIECISNGTMMISEYQWKKSGEAVLVILVYTNSSFNDSDYLDCGVTRVTVAVDYGLNLTVELFNDPYLLDDATQPVRQINTESHRDPNDAWADQEDDDPAYIVGNLTFVTFTSLTFGEDDIATYYFKFIISGPTVDDVCTSNLSNLTFEYPEVGYYQYTIHAIAKLNRMQAHHANISGYFWLLDGVSDTVMQVGNNNSVKVGSKQEVMITAEGSTPITVCWYETKLGPSPSSLAPDDVNFSPPDPLATPPPFRNGSQWIPLENCVVLNDSNDTVFRQQRTFNEVGTFQFVAKFFNRASRAEKNFTYQVVSGPSPGVVASSATAVVVLAVLVAVAVVIAALVAGGYIPYRRYKNRTTETADFRFVDLSETRSYWDRLKLKTNQFRDYFWKRRHNEKIGLVNLTSDPVPEQRRLFYGTNTLTQFAPYETL